MPAQGIRKTLAYKIQTAQGSPASGSGGQLLRRRTATFNLTRETYENDEIVSHQQSTGATAGMRRVSGTLNGLLSPSTFTDLFECLLRKVFAAVTSIAAASITIATSGSNWSLTRAAGSFLTDGIKIGQVVRLTVGSFNAANTQKNLIVLAVTATVLTVTPVNGVALVAEGPITGATLAVPGKLVFAPTTGHTDEWFTFEQWFADVPRSELYTDVKVSSANIGIPASGNTTVDFGFVGLNRSLDTTQKLTTPGAETTTSVVGASANGVIVVGSTVTRVTGATVNIDGGVAAGDAEVGANVASDLNIARIKVSGQFTAKFNTTALQQIYEDQTATTLILVMPVDATANSDFVTITLPKLKIFSDDADDGEKAIIRTYNYTAEIQGAGGAGTAFNQTIVQIQDSQA